MIHISQPWMITYTEALHDVWFSPRSDREAILIKDLTNTRIWRFIIPDYTGKKTWDQVAVIMDTDFDALTPQEWEDLKPGLGISFERIKFFYKTKFAISQLETPTFRFIVFSDGSSDTS